LIDYPPSKLKSGSGEAVCQALHGLVQTALKAQKFKFRTPVIPEDDEGDDGAEMGDGENMEGNADIADLVGNEIDDDDDIAELVETGANDLRANDFENPDNAIIEAAVDPDEWYRE
jgi:estrogen-related receptor beta like 1